MIEWFIALGPWSQGGLYLLVLVVAFILSAGDEKNGLKKLIFLVLLLPVTMVIFVLRFILGRSVDWLFNGEPVRRIADKAMELTRKVWE